MRRHLLLVLALLAAASLSAEDSTLLVAGAPSVLVLEGSSNVTDWRCEGTTLDGQMEVAADQIEDFYFRVPVATLRCGNRHMERDMYHALRSRAHPSIEFRFTELISGGANVDGAYRAKISGVLSLAGTARTIAIDVEARRLSRERLHLRARLPLRMTDFRIQPPTALLGLVKAKNELTVDLDLVLEAGP